MKMITNLNLKMLLMTNLDDFNEDTCEVCLYDVENVVHSTENNVEVQELFEDDRNFKKNESKDATQDKVEDFNENTCNVCAYDF